MAQLHICPQCGREFAEGSRICTNCGCVLKADDQQTEGGKLPEAKNLNALPTGVLLHERYEIRGLLGQGGFGITYDGIDRTLNAHVAIKEYFPKGVAERHSSYSCSVTVASVGDRSSYEKGMSKFLQEAQNLARFSGAENFVHVSDYFRENGTAYIVMEFVDGMTISQYLESNGPMTFDQCMQYLVPVMNALQKVHESHLIHRDVSPSNIIIMTDGRVKLLDFGAAREVTEDMQTMSVIVRPDYAPIEQYSSHRKQGPYTDVYALCATMYTMLTKAVPMNPFTRLSSPAPLTPPSKLGAKISPAQEDVLMQGLAIQPEDRIQSMKELRDRFLYADDGGSRSFEPVDDESTVYNPDAAVRDVWEDAPVPVRQQRGPSEPYPQQTNSGNILFAVFIVVDILLVLGILWLLFRSLGKTASISPGPVRSPLPGHLRYAFQTMLRMMPNRIAAMSKTMAALFSQAA